jgi:hypothetical protein
MPATERRADVPTEELLARNVQRMREVPAWKLARELGVPVGEILVYMDVHGVTSPLRGPTVRSDD